MKTALRLFTGLAVVACANFTSPEPGVGIAVPAFASVDEDHNGSVNREEFQKLTSTLFDQLDTNHDGVLSPDEYNQLRPRPPRARPNEEGGYGGGRRRPRGGGGYPGGGFPGGGGGGLPPF
jgi:hypothetical protein